MPIYEYEPKDGDCSKCDGRFEDLQSLNDKPHETCPTCDKPCHRVFSKFYAKTWRTKTSVSEKNLAKKGFTQYKKVGKGQYEKSFGTGPKQLKSD